MPRKGCHQSEEAKRKISESKMGEKNSSYSPAQTTLTHTYIHTYIHTCTHIYK